MTRRVVLATTALLALAVAAPASAAPATGAGIETGDRFICVMTDTQRNQGYCVKTSTPDWLPLLP